MKREFIKMLLTLLFIGLAFHSVSFVPFKAFFALLIFSRQKKKLFSNKFD